MLHDGDLKVKIESG